MDKDSVFNFIDKILKKDSIQPLDLFWGKYEGDEEDLLCTFFTYLMSNCVIRYDSKSMEYGMYKFSKPGKEILENKQKRDIFVLNFLRLYYCDENVEL